MDLRQKKVHTEFLGGLGTGKTGVFMEEICGGSKRGAQKFVLFSRINVLYQITRLELDVTAYIRQKGFLTK